MPNVDVLVIGLGPAGASASLSAAKRGLSVAAIERKEVVGVPVQCAEFIPLPLSKYAQQADVILQKIDGMKSILPSGSATHTGFAGLMISRSAFDQALAREAQSRGANLHLSSTLKRLDFSANTAWISTPLGLVEFHYQVLIAADGPHSAVTRALHLTPLQMVNTRQYTVDLCHSYRDTDIWLSDSYPGGYAWMFPKGKHANLGLGADKKWQADLKTPLDNLHRQLISQGVVGEKISYRTGGAIPVGGLRENLVHHNILITGDAAGLTHPITGAGIAAAVISGERAGEAAADFIAGPHPASLAGYEEDIRDQFEASIARAVQRRTTLSNYWRTDAAYEDANHRQGWIAFPEYFEDEDCVLAACA